MNYFFYKMPAQRDKCSIFKCNHFEYFSPLLHVRYYPSHHSSSRVCAGGGGFGERGIITLISVSWFCEWYQIRNYLHGFEKEKRHSQKQTDLWVRSRKQKLKLMLKVENLRSSPIQSITNLKKKSLSPYLGFQHHISSEQSFFCLQPKSCFFNPKQNCNI